MERTKLIKWLRISVSAVCLIVTVGLIGLWVRSYHQIDKYTALGHRVWSGDGNLSLDEFWVPSKGQSWTEKEIDNAIWWNGAYNRNTGEGEGITIPYWSLVLLFATLAYVPWIPWHRLNWRFSLRTMLIATAAVAVLLGLIVVFAR